MNDCPPTKNQAGFTLVETIIAVFITAVVMTSTLGLLFYYIWTWRDVEVRIDTSEAVSRALHQVVYGTVGGASRGLRSASNVTRTTTAQGWRVSYDNSEGDPAGFLEYDANDQLLFFSPAGGGQPVIIAQFVTQAQAIVDDNALELTVQIALDRGRYAATQQFQTTIRRRN